MFFVLNVPRNGGFWPPEVKSGCSEKVENFRFFDPQTPIFGPKAAPKGPQSPGSGSRATGKAGQPAGEMPLSRILGALEGSPEVKSTGIVQKLWKFYEFYIFGIFEIFRFLGVERQGAPAA